MKKRLVIVSYDGVYDFEKNQMVIGGEETYYMDLARLAFSMDWNVSLYLISKDIKSKKSTYEGMEIETIHKKTPFKSLNQSSFDFLFSTRISQNDVVVIGQENMGIKAPTNRVITIQHGVYHDFPGTMINNICRSNHFLQDLYKFRTNLLALRRFRKDKNLVCVDYNYYNWVRTLTSIYSDQDVTIIPNYTSKSISENELELKQRISSQRKKIVFARRFVENRGALLFARIAKRLLKENFDVEITFAGSGPLQTEMKSIIGENSNVHFTRYKPQESIEFHKKFDIVVVPTIYAEGTSLSVLEAMGAGCLPIVSYVGGLTNVIIDGYNGRITKPTEEAFYMAIVEVLSLSKEEFNYIQHKAYETSTKAFGIDNWQKKWQIVLENALAL